MDANGTGDSPPTTRLDGRPGPLGLVDLAYERHAPELARFARRLTGDAAAADDLVAEAFLRLVGAISGGQAPCHVRAWLYRVVANLAASRGRHASVVERAAPQLAAQEGPELPEANALRRDLDRVLLAALDVLALDAREAVVLAAEGYSGREIARTIGRTETATRTLICRARRRLRDGGELQAAIA